MASYLDGMLRYFEFSGRSSRMQYWMFFLVQTVLTAGAIYADFSLGGFADPRHPVPTVTLFAALVHIVPGVTLSVRRLHDIGRSGLWYLLNLVPFGAFVLVYWACCASDMDDNGYGPADGEAAYLRAEPKARNRSSIPAGVRMGAASGSGAGNKHVPNTGRFI
jgi:uncharacterized membrane protein YhaH (DUF805 family)